MSISRRKLLAASGALSGLACKPSAPAAPVVPRFVGQSPERGHHLRAGDLLASPIAARERCPVVIVGGGASGLCAAWSLVRGGLAPADLLLLELEDELGGTARSGALPRSAHPTGAHYLPTPPRECVELLELLEDIGLLVGRTHTGAPEYRSTAILSAPEERHFYAKRWAPGLYPAEGETLAERDQWERFWNELRELDRRRDGSGELLFRLPVRRSARGARHLDGLSVEQWLSLRGYDSWRLRWYVDYACRDDYGCSAAQTSAFAGLHHFLGRGLEETREGQLLTWAGGNGELLEMIRARLSLGDRLRRGQLVYDLEPGELGSEARASKPARVRVRDLAHARSVEIEAQAVLWAAPRFVLPRVLPRGRDRLQPPDARPFPLSYAPWLVANLELSQAPAGLGASLAWDNVPVIEDPARRNLGYVLATHQEDRLEVYEPGAVITYYEPLVADDAGALARRRGELLGASAEQLGERVLRALEPMHPGVRGWLRGLHLHRWGHAMLRPTPNLLFAGPLTQARKAIGRVRACAADCGGLPLFEEAFYMAHEVAQWALEQLEGRAPRVEP